MSPYESLSPQQFWKRSIPGKAISEVDDLYRRKFSLTGSRIATAGSCFAQYIARYLTSNGYDVVDTEPPPAHLTEEEQGDYGYGLYSARFGNIYTVRQLLQLLLEATGYYEPGEVVWTTPTGRYCDALRPGVEPNGFASPDSVLQSRRQHLARVREVIETADVFIFTLGLTEAWVHSASGSVFPIVPGTRLGGTFEQGVYKFHNFGFQEIYADFLKFRRVVRRLKPDMKFILTVSPVPLIATATSNHVLTATTYSKSVLRAVAGQLAAENDDIDYFPSYEIITAPFFQRYFYEQENAREVTDEGVQTVMDVFFRAHDKQRDDGKAPVGIKPVGIKDVGAAADGKMAVTRKKVRSKAADKMPVASKAVRATANGKAAVADKDVGSAVRQPAPKKKRLTCEEIMLNVFSKS